MGACKEGGVSTICQCVGMKDESEVGGGHDGCCSVVNWVKEKNEKKERKGKEMNEDDR